MAVVREKKTSRLDLRMSEEQRDRIDEAARLNGMSVSQWSLSKLMESAREDIAQNNQIVLTSSSFDEFERLLEGEVDPVFEKTRSRTTRWEK